MSVSPPQEHSYSKPSTSRYGLIVISRRLSEIGTNHILEVFNNLIVSLVFWGFFLVRPIFKAHLEFKEAVKLLWV